MAESSGWAAEASNLLRTFDRFSERIAGLVVALVVWTLLVTQLGKLGTDASPVVQSATWSFGSITVRPSHPIVVWLAGCFVVALGWSAWSGTWRYFTRPLTYSLRYPLWGVWLVLTCVVGILQLPIAGLITVVQAAHVRQKLKRMPPEQRQRQVTLLGHADLVASLRDDAIARLISPARESLEQALGEQKLQELQSSVGIKEAAQSLDSAARKQLKDADIDAEAERLAEASPDRARQVAAMGSKRLAAQVRGALNYSPSQVLQWWHAAVQSLYLRYLAGAKIGIARFEGFSYEEDMEVSRVLGQAFSVAEAHLRNVLTAVPQMKFLRFEPLPAIVRVRSHFDAIRTRTRLRQDALIWGSMHPGKTNRLWINLNWPEPEHTTDEPDDTVGRLWNRHPCDRRPQQAGSVSINPHSIRDAYTVLALALLGGLRARKRRDLDKSKVSKSEDIFDQADPWRRSWSVTQQVEAQLIREFVHAGVMSKNAEDKDGTLAESELIQFASEWAQDRIEGVGGSFGSDGPEAAMWVLRHCCALRPRDPQHQYRAAVAANCSDQFDEAVSRIKAAMDLDRSRVDGPPSDAVLHGRVAIELELGSLLDSPRTLASVAVRAARAVAWNGASVRHELWSQFKKTIHYRLLQYQPEPPQKYRVLLEVLGPEPEARDNDAEPQPAGAHASTG